MGTKFSDFMAELENEAAAEGPEAVAELQALRVKYGLVRAARAFLLDEEQLARVDAWFKHHFEVVRGPKWRPRDMSGASIKFTIIPTELGPSEAVECLWCPKDTKGAKIDLSKDDYEEFCYDYDENWHEKPLQQAPLIPVKIER